MKQRILSNLSSDHPWRQSLICFDSVGSTNDIAKDIAKQNAPEGTVIVASSQTAGRGRLGRSFHAPTGLGLYISLIIRPLCPPEKLLHLTCAAAVAVCEAAELCTGFRPRIKWTNDLVAGNKKLGGILTELSVNSKSGLVEWAVIGIGINCRHQQSDFPPEIQDMACSLLQATSKEADPAQLAACLMQTFYEVNSRLLSDQKGIIQTYRKDCMTVGQEIILIRGDSKRYGTALDIAPDGALTVRFQDGTTENIQSGEVSVRGLYGYV